MEEDIVRTHMQELRHKAHVEGVEELGNNEYNVMYSPQSTNSPYSHLCFRVRFIIPEQYPEEPPKLMFLDKIYHLNIDPVTGDVHMGLLAEDWSPYLTLTAVIDSIDSIMEEPDLEYAATAALQDEYIYEPDNYLKKIQQTIKAYSSVLVLDNSHHMAEHVKRIKESSVSSRNQDHSFAAFEMNEVNSVDCIQRLDSKEITSSPQAYDTATNTRADAPKIKIQTLSDIPYQGPEQYLTQSKFTKKSGNEYPAIQVDLLHQSRNKAEGDKWIKLKKKQEPKIRSGLTDGKPITINSEFQKIQINLRRADSMSQLLMGEWEVMESTIKRTQSAKLRQKLVQKQQRILQMIDETLELSSSLREKMLEELRSTTKPLLK